MREIPSVHERPAGFPTTSVTNELARAVQAMSPLLTEGQRQPQPIGALFDTWLVWDEGPDGEDDTTDHTYWLRRAYVSNEAADPPATNDPAELTEVTSTLFPLTDWIRATNLAERPSNFTGAEEVEGPHGLSKGQAVGPVWSETDSNDPRVERYVFFATATMARLKIDSDRTKGGVYKAYIWLPPETIAIDFTAAGSLSEANIGVQGAEVHAVNLLEIGQNTHDLTTGTPKAKFAWGVKSLLRSSSDTKPVYEIVLPDWENCT